jgi:antitoxin ParD1/3/4
MGNRVSINVSLTPEMERFVESRVASGRYQSVSEVIRDGLRLLEEKELARQSALKTLQEKIAVGLEQIKKRKVHDRATVFKEIAHRSRKRRDSHRVRSRSASS